MPEREEHTTVTFLLQNQNSTLAIPYNSTDKSSLVYLMKTL